MASKARGLADLGNAFNDGALSNRNLIINGAMQVTQRGTSHTYSANESGYHTIDRIFSAAFGSGVSLTISQETADYSGVDAEKFLRATPSGTVSAGFATIYSEHRIENIKSFSNKTLTLSFYVKAASALTFQFRTHNYYGSGGSAEEYSSLSDIAATTSWTKQTITFTVGDLSGKTVGSGNYFGLMFYWSTDQGSNNLNDVSIDVTNVQLEVGDTATPFEHRSYGQELALAQRFFQKSNKDGYYQLPSSSGGQIQRQYLRFSPTMRTAPTMTTTKTGGSAATAVGIDGSERDGLWFSFGGNQYDIIYWDWTADAEL